MSSKSLNILMLVDVSGQNIPLRTEIAEVFGSHLSKTYNITVFQLSAPIYSLINLFPIRKQERHFFWRNMEFYQFSIIRFFIKTFKFIKKYNYDAILIRNDPYFLYFIKLLNKKLKKPLIYQYTIPYGVITEEEYSIYNPRYYFRKIIFSLLIKAMKKVNLILPTSNTMKKHLNLLGVENSKMLNFPNGVNTSLFKVSNEKKSNLNKCPLFVYQGVMDKVRDLNVLIRAFKLVQNKYKNSRLLMIGDGNDYNNLKNLTIELNLEDNISFTGKVSYSDVSRYLEEADVALCPIPPSKRFKLSTPLKLLEYMSSQKPVIANREIPTQLEVIQKSKCGILTNYSVQSFAKAMCYLSRNPDEAFKMGKRGREWVENNSSYNILALKLAQEIQKLV